jgi:hypothetical protein
MAVDEAWRARETQQPKPASRPVRDRRKRSQRPVRRVRDRRETKPTDHREVRDRRERSRPPDRGSERPVAGWMQPGELAAASPAASLPDDPVGGRLGVSIVDSDPSSLNDNERLDSMSPRSQRGRAANRADD